MRRPTSFTDRRGGLDVTMTPMIDVVFLLLIFFITTASLQIVKNEDILQSSVTAVLGSEPNAQDEPPPPEADFQDVVVRITWTGRQPRWTVNGQPMSNLAQLRMQMDRIAKIKNDAAVILHPDKNVPLGHVIDVYDIARLVGFQKVQFAASEEI